MEEKPNSFAYFLKNKEYLQNLNEMHSALTEVGQRYMDENLYANKLQDELKVKPKELIIKPLLSHNGITAMSRNEKICIQEDLNPFHLSDNLVSAVAADNYFTKEGIEFDKHGFDIRASRSQRFYMNSNRSYDIFRYHDRYITTNKQNFASEAHEAGKMFYDLKSNTGHKLVKDFFAVLKDYGYQDHISRYEQKKIGIDI